MNKDTVITIHPKYVKKYKCPYCEKRLDRQKLITHIEKVHEDMIPENYTTTRVVFNLINKKTQGKCVICGKETEWNEDKARYERICSSPKCKKSYIDQTADRLYKKHGKTKQDFLNDPKFQEKMLQNRSISGKYKFQDGGVLPYVGSYEKNFLQFMDQFFHVKSSDLIAPGPVIDYKFNGKTHQWITDFYYEPYNLVFDIKDGGSNPNTREMNEYRAKQIAKEKAIKDMKQYNYIRLTDNQFDQMIELMLELKENLIDTPVNTTRKVIIRVNEGVSSVLNKNHKQKGSKKLSFFKKVSISENVISKYKEDYKFLSHIKTDKNCKGYLFFYDKELVAVLSVEYKENGENWIQAIEIVKKYQGYGLSEQLLDMALKEFNAAYLSVNKNNELAIYIYKKKGFVVYKETDTMYFMRLSSIKESVIYESNNKFKYESLSTDKEIKEFKVNFRKTFHTDDDMSDSNIKKSMKRIMCDNKLIGYVGFSKYNIKGKKYLGIGNFMILPEYQKSGYGSSVIDDIINKKKNTYYEIYCYVDKDNKNAINFYKKIANVNTSTLTEYGYYVILYRKSVIESVSSSINTIIFDIGSVLVQQVPLEISLRQENRKFIPEELIDQLVKIWCSSGTEQGSLEEQITTAYLKAYESGLRGPNRQYMEYIASESLRNIKRCDYTIPMLRALKMAGYKLYILSNWGKWHFEELQKRNEFREFLQYFDGGIVSYQVGLKKPDRKIYEILIDKYNINPSSAVFYDDKPENIQAAKEVGLNAVVFDRSIADSIINKKDFILTESEINYLEKYVLMF